MVVLAMLLASAAMLSVEVASVDPVWTTSMTKYKNELQDLLQKGATDLPTKPRDDVLKVIGEKLVGVVKDSHSTGEFDCDKQGDGKWGTFYFCYSRCKIYDLRQMISVSVTPVTRNNKPYASIKFKFDELRATELMFLGNVWGKKFAIAHNFLKLGYKKDNLFELVAEVLPNNELAAKWTKGECILKVVDFKTEKLELETFDLKSNCKGATAIIRSFFQEKKLVEETNAQVWKSLKKIIPDTNDSLICIGDRLQTEAAASPQSSGQTGKKPKQPKQLSEKEIQKRDEYFATYCGPGADISNNGATSDGSVSP